MTHIEDCVAKILDSLKLEYEREFQVGVYRLDFYIPRLKIGIECDGEWFHRNLFKRDLRDKEIIHISRTTEYPVEKILHFWGREIIKRPEVVRADIKKELKELVA